MSNFKRYFTYHIRSNTIRALVILALSVVYLYREGRGGYSTDFTCLSTIIGFMATLIPIFEFYTFKTKRNLDTYFSLPISRQNLALCHFLSGLFEMICVFTVSTVFLFILKLLYNSFYLIYFIPYYFCTLLYSILLYSFFTFVFNIGNTVIDGVLMIILYIFGPFLIVGAADSVYREFTTGYMIHGVNGFIYEPLSDIANEFEHLSDKDPSPLYSGISTESYIFAVVCIIICIAAFFAFLYFFQKTKPENTEGISDSPFGYKTMIPVCGISIAIINLNPVLNIFLMAIGYIIYRRGFKFQRSDLIVFGISSVLSILLA